MILRIAREKVGHRQGPIQNARSQQRSGVCVCGVTNVPWRRLRDMDTRAETFQKHRSKLYGIAYRMLGSRSDAEDMLQEAYLRWHRTDSGQVRTPEAWLTTAITRL